MSSGFTTDSFYLYPMFSLLTMMSVPDEGKGEDMIFNKCLKEIQQLF